MIARARFGVKVRVEWPQTATAIGFSMRETRASAPDDVETGAELAEGLRPLVEGAEAAAVRTAMQDRLRRTEPWVKSAFKHRKRLCEAVVVLAKGDQLGPLIRLLDRADNDAMRRFMRDSPDVHTRPTRTADRLRTFLAEDGTPRARKAFARALRKIEAVGGAEALAEVERHLEAGDELAAARVIERVLDSFFGQPESDEVIRLKVELDLMLDGIIKKGHVKTLSRALARHDAEGARRLGRLQVYGLEARLHDLMQRYGSDSRSSAWKRAIGHATISGPALAQALRKDLKEGNAEQAIERLADDLLTPLDDRFGPPTEAARKCLDDMVARLVQEKALIDVVRAAADADADFRRKYPQVILVGTLHRLQSASDRLGSAATQEHINRALAEVAPEPETGAAQASS
jgi:hypothetical protein